MPPITQRLTAGVFQFRLDQEPDGVPDLSRSPRLWKIPMAIPAVQGSGRHKGGGNGVNLLQPLTESFARGNQASWPAAGFDTNHAIDKGEDGAAHSVSSELDWRFQRGGRALADRKRVKFALGIFRRRLEKQ